MKIGLELKNPDRALRPARNDVILYDGKQWYVTTKEELLKALDDRLKAKEKALDDKIAECDRKIAEVNELKVSVARQLLSFSEIIEGLVTEEDK